VLDGYSPVIMSDIVSEKLRRVATLRNTVIQFED